MIVQGVQIVPEVSLIRLIRKLPESPAQAAQRLNRRELAAHHPPPSGDPTEGAEPASVKRLARPGGEPPPTGRVHDSLRRDPRTHFFIPRLQADLMSAPRRTLDAMVDLPPTSRAVADAVHHYRQLRELTLDELAYVLAQLGHGLTTEDLRRIEDAERPATVDDLIAIAAALDARPAILLSHIPIDMPVPETPLATGLPADVEQPELRAWLEGKTGLDHRARLRWAIDQVARLQIRSTHFEDQLRAAREELNELGELALQEADAPQVVDLEYRIREGGHELTQAELGLALADQRLERLRAGVSRAE